MGGRGTDGCQRTMILVDAAKLWWRARKLKLSTWLFNKLYNDPDSGMRALIENGVNQRATGAIMAWLDYKRIMHCEFCPHTEQLKKSEKGYRCEKHMGGIRLVAV